MSLERVENIFGRTGKRLIRVARFLWYVRMGRENGYPICCVLHFALDRVQDKQILSAVERGGIFDGTPYVYVPCRFHKGRHPYWTPWDGQGGYGKNQLKLFQLKPTKLKESDG